MENMRKEIIQAVEREKVIAIIRDLPLEQCIPVAWALWRGGIRLMEITFDQAHPEHHAVTAAAIDAIRANFADKILVGAGTVTSPELVDLAADAGADYIIAPDSNERVIARTRERGLVSIPGALTPDEIMRAHAAGADFVKLFPASSLGSSYLKAVRAPLSHIKLLAVGGIHAGNAREFLDAGACGLGIGGNLARKDWIAAGAYDNIAATAKNITDAVKEVGK